MTFTLMSALTLMSKLGISIAVFALLIVTEIAALAMLVKWKKGYRTAGGQQSAVADAQTDGVVGDDGAQTPADAVIVDHSDQSATGESSIDEGQEVSSEGVYAPETGSEKSTYAFAPLGLLAAAAQVTSVRYVLYALIGISVVLGAAVLITALAFAKSVTKPPKESSDADQPTQDDAVEAEAMTEQESEVADVEAIEPEDAEIVDEVEETVQEELDEPQDAAVEAEAMTEQESEVAEVEAIEPEDAEIIDEVEENVQEELDEAQDDAVEAEAMTEQESEVADVEAIETEDAEIVDEVEETVQEELDEPQDDAVEAQAMIEQESETSDVEASETEESAALDDGVLTDSVSADEETVAEDVQTSPMIEEQPAPVPVKRQPPARERTIVVDDKPVQIKDDRFLFNPEEDGYYYVLEKTFTAKLIQSEEIVKAYYTELKNELLSYTKVHARMSKKRESFNFGRVCMARLTIRGKTLRLHLALDPREYEETKYKVEDTSEIKSLADTPLMYKIRNDRRLKYAKDLIATMMAQFGAERQEIDPIDYQRQYPYEMTEALLAKGLITKRRVQGKVPEDKGFDFAQKTFKAKLIQSDPTVKEYYSQLKNRLLSYRKVHDRMSKQRETFRFGRVCVARMAIRGKTLKLYLALRAADYEETKYKVEDVSDIKSYVDTPLLTKIKNNRRMKYALDLIDAAMAQVGAAPKREAVSTDYVAELPFENTEDLYEKGLIVNRHISGNSFLAQRFAAHAQTDAAEAAADEDEA